MSFNPSISLPDIIQFLLIGGGLFLIYFKAEKKSDERILKNESEIEKMKEDFKKSETNCQACKTELNGRITDVENRASNRFTDFTQRMESMESNLRTDIQAVQQNIINILTQK